jgi:type IV secretion system protein VirB10
MPGADPAGYAGFRDKVNRHVGRRIGAALMMTVFNLAFEVTRREGETPVGFQTQSAVTAAVGQSIAELGKQMVEREMDVPNTLEIRPGYRFNVMVNKDIAFESPYRRR